MTVGRRPTGREWLALVTICVTTLALKIPYTPDLRLSLDGSFYVNVARHVAEGAGLQTTLSLYHHGYSAFPHPTHVYPVWPLVLGSAGAVATLDAAARVLPILLSPVVLALFFLLARATARRILTERVREAHPHLTGLTALAGTGLLAANHVFFRTTTLPYTEALALALSLCALLATVGFANRPRALPAATAGGLAGLAYLTRSQCVAIPLGILAALLVCGLRDGRARRGAAVFAGVALLVVIPWIVYLVTVLDPFDPRVLLDFAAYRETAALAPFRYQLRTGSALGFLLDRAGGLLVAFDPRSTLSYVWNWGPAAYLVPLAVVVAVRSPARLRGWLSEAGRLDSLPVVAVLLVGVLALLPVHMLHSAYWYEWWFGQRYGLFLGLLLILALPLVVGEGHWWRIAVVCLTGISLLHGANLVRQHYRLDSPDPAPARLELEAWLSTLSDDAVLLSVDPQPLSLHSRAGFHWVHCRESADHTRNLLETLPIDYVIVFPRNRGCPFVGGLEGLAREAGFGSGPQEIEVLRVRP